MLTGNQKFAIAMQEAIRSAPDEDTGITLRDILSRHTQQASAPPAGFGSKEEQG